MYKTDNPRLYGTASVLLLLNAVAIQGLNPARPMTLEKRFEFYSGEKMSRSDRLITYEWKTTIFGKQLKEFKELSHAKRAVHMLSLTNCLAVCLISSQRMLLFVFHHCEYCPKVYTDSSSEKGNGYFLGNNIKRKT